jgi:hypothetical protein
VAVDINRIVASAIEAALDGQEHHEPEHHESRHRGLKALAAGAALVAGARVVANQAPKLTKLGGIAGLSYRAAHLSDTIKDKLADLDLGGDDDDDVDDVDDVDDEDYGGDDDYEEPEDEGGGDDAEEEPEDEEPEDEEEHASSVTAGDGSAVEQAAQGLEIDTNGHRASRSRHLDPVGRPPEPPSSS